MTPSRMVLLRRADGDVAEIQMSEPPRGGESALDALLRECPVSAALIEPRMVVPAGDADIALDAERDEDLAMWLAEAVDYYCGGLDESGAVIEADRDSGQAVVTWDGPEGSASQAIYMRPGDMELIVLGHDPVAEGWEDGHGRPVCRESAEEGSD